MTIWDHCPHGHSGVHPVVKIAITTIVLIELLEVYSYPYLKFHLSVLYKSFSGVQNNNMKLSISFMVLSWVHSSPYFLILNTGKTTQLDGLKWQNLTTIGFIMISRINWCFYWIWSLENHQNIFKNFEGI